MENNHLYLDLLKRTLSRYVCPEHYQPIGYYHGKNAWVAKAYRPLRSLLGSLNLELVWKRPVDLKARYEGRDWPVEAETMIGIKRLDNIEHCIRQVVADSIPGDLIETGVWRGGAAIFMKGVLDVLNDTSRNVWLADSFAWLPKPDPNCKMDVTDETQFWAYNHLAASVEQVKENFRRYGLLDDRVRFLVGWFKDTLPKAPIERLSLLRLDGDMYQSTMDALTALYPKLSPGGYCIIDDYGCIDACKLAVDHYRKDHDVTTPLVVIDGSGVYWQKQ